MQSSKSIDYNLLKRKEKNFNFQLYNTTTENNEITNSRLWYPFNHQFHENQVEKIIDKRNKENLSSLGNFTCSNSFLSTPLTLLQRKGNKTKLFKNPPEDYETIFNSRDENKDYSNLNFPYSRIQNIKEIKKGNLKENYINNDYLVYAGNPEGIYGNIANSAKFTENKLATLTEISDTCEVRSPPNEVLENKMHENYNPQKMQILNNIQNFQREIQNKCGNSYSKTVEGNISKLDLHPQEIGLIDEIGRDEMTERSERNDRLGLDIKNKISEMSNEINQNKLNQNEMKTNNDYLLDKINESTYRRMAEKSKKILSKIKHYKGFSNASRLSSEKLGDNEIWREKQAEILDKSKGVTFNPYVN